MEDPLEGRTVLVTGGTGSIGSEIVKQIMTQEAEKIVIFSRDENKQFLMRKRIVDDRLRTIVGDIRNSREVQNLFDTYHFDLVFHAEDALP